MLRESLTITHSLPFLFFLSISVCERVSVASLVSLFHYLTFAKVLKDSAFVHSSTGNEKWRCL